MSWKMKYERNWGQLGMRYKTYTMEDALEAIIDYRGKTPKKSEKGIPTLSAKSVKNNHIDYDSCYYISSDEYKRFMVRGLPQIGDVLLTTEAPLGMVAQLDRNDVGIAQRLLTLRGKQGVLDNEYLLYYLQSPIGQALLRARETGTTVTGIKQSEFRKIQIGIPDIENQRKIGGILRGLDDKIAINNSINKNLEQQAQALFKSWFLDYEPWDGSVPDSWNSGKLGNFVEIKRGGSPRPIQEYLSDSGLRWLKISDVTSLQTPFVIDIKDHIIEAGLRKTVFLKAGSLVLSNSATPGVPKIIDVDSCIHDGWLYFPESKFSKEYLYLYFKYIRQQLVNLSNGSVFNNLKTDILKGYPTKLPDKETLQRFDNIVKPMFLQMQNLTRESHKLVDMRNALLPKLISGELDVSNIDL